MKAPTSYLSVLATWENRSPFRVCAGFVRPRPPQGGSLQLALGERENLKRPPLWGSGSLPTPLAKIPRTPPRSCSID